MAKRKSREQYALGSVTPVMVDKVNRDGIVILGADGKPEKVQRRNKAGQLAWRVCVSNGTEDYTDKQGHRRKRQLKVQRNVYGTLAEARKYRDELSKQYEHVDLESARKTFSWAAERWVQWATDKNIAGPDTIRQYECRLNYAAAYIGDKALAELTPDDIDHAVSSVMRERGLSNRTGNKIFAAIKRVLKYCVDRGWSVRNPADATVPPKVGKVDPTTRRSLSAEEAARLRATLDRDIQKAIRDYNEKESRQAEWGTTFGRSSVRGISDVSHLVCVRLLLASGCRRGEILGLTWDAVDFRQSTITIRQSLNARMEPKSPKTESGIRTLTLDSSTMDLLKRWKTQQEKMLHLVMPDGKAISQTPKTPVCCSNVGGWCDPHNMQRWWSRYRKSIGFDTLLLHELRHTSASLLLGNGYDLMTLAHRLGHKKATLTLAEYGHMLPTNDQKAADLMGNILDAHVQPSGGLVLLDARSA